MNDSLKLIHDRQDKIRQDFGNEARLYEYLFETMDNFYYRYLETTETKNLKTQELANKIFGARSFESSMVEALKIKNKEAHAGIMTLAKSIPKAQKPLIRLSLSAQVKELHTDKGHLILSSEIHWGFPEFTDETQMIRKNVTFKYDDLGHFRKELAIKLEDACDLFS